MQERELSSERERWDAHVEGVLEAAGNDAARRTHKGKLRDSLKRSAFVMRRHAGLIGMSDLEYMDLFAEAAGSDEAREVARKAILMRDDPPPVAENLAAFKAHMHRYRRR